MTDARKLWTSGSKVPVVVDSAEIAEKARKLGRRLYWSNVKEYVAGAIVIPIFLAYAFIPESRELPPMSRFGSVMIAVGTVVVLGYLWRKGGSGAKDLEWGETTLRAYRKQLVRRRDLLRSVPRWYLGPLVPGLFLFHLGVALARPEKWPGGLLAAAISLGVFVAIALLNRHGARKLDAEIAALPPDES